MTSQRFIDTRTNEIVVQVPISEIAHFEEYNGQEQPVCPHCKKAEVSADAAVRWDVATQDWIISNIFDDDKRCENFDCDAAGEEITPLWVAVPKEVGHEG